MPPSLLILKVISKVTNLKMGSCYHILFIISVKFYYFELGYL